MVTILQMKVAKRQLFEKGNLKPCLSYFISIRGNGCVISVRGISYLSLLHRHMTNGAVIARCSQPEVGWFGWRSQEDETLLHALGKACATDSVSASLKKQLIKEMGVKNHHTNGHTDAIPNGDVVYDSTGDDNDDEGKDVAACSVIEQRKVLIVDARAYTAAVVNRAKGGGCECEGKFDLISNSPSLPLHFPVDCLTL